MQASANSPSIEIKLDPESPIAVARGNLKGRSDNMTVLTNPYFWGYVLLVLLLVRCGSWMRSVHEENVAKRQASKAQGHPAWDADV
jgi:hypothetical protein